MSLPVLTDEQLTDLIYRHLKGESLAKLAKEIGKSKSTVTNWCAGNTRGHCLEAAEARIRAEG